MDENIDQLPEIYIGIPGPWRDTEELYDVIVRQTEGRYIATPSPSDSPYPNFFGLAHLETGWFGACEVAPANPELVDGLPLMGFTRYGATTSELRKHRSIAILRAPGGSLENATAMRDGADEFMKCGGLGVIIESTGVAHAPQDWRKLTDSEDQWGALYWTFVTTIGPKGRTCYTCGMHNLGMRDAITDIFDDPGEAAWIMHNFLGYVSRSGQPVVSGDAFGDEGDNIYRAVHEPCNHLEKNDLFHNPYGMWRIVPLPESERKNLRRFGEGEGRN